MKKLIILIILVVVGFNANSQSMHGISYSMALPVGETADFISKYQWRGFGLEGKYFVDDNITLGWQTGWNTMYESKSGSFTEGTRTRTGKQYNYLNIFPALFTANYFLFEDGDTQPYFGVGAGTYWIEQRSQMGLFADTNSQWHFGFAPEIGVLIPMNLQSNFYINARYNYALKTGDSMTYSYLTFNVGFLWY